jgi:hypothetical protein
MKMLVPAVAGSARLALYAMTRKEKGIFTETKSNFKEGKLEFDEFGRQLALPFSWQGEQLCEPFMVSVIDEYKQYLASEAEKLVPLLNLEVAKYKANLEAIKAKPRKAVNVGTAVCHIWTEEQLYEFYLLNKYFDPVIATFRGNEYLLNAATVAINDYHTAKGLIDKEFNEQLQKLCNAMPVTNERNNQISNLISKCLAKRTARQANSVIARENNIKLQILQGKTEAVLKPYTLFTKCVDLNERITIAEYAIDRFYSIYENVSNGSEHWERKVDELTVLFLTILKVFGIVNVGVNQEIISLDLIDRAVLPSLPMGGLWSKVKKVGKSIGNSVYSRIVEPIVDLPSNVCNLVKDPASGLKSIGNHYFVKPFKHAWRIGESVVDAFDYAIKDNHDYSRDVICRTGNVIDEITDSLKGNIAWMFGMENELWDNGSTEAYTNKQNDDKQRLLRFVNFLVVGCENGVNEAQYLREESGQTRKSNESPQTQRNVFICRASMKSMSFIFFDEADMTNSNVGAMRALNDDIRNYVFDNQQQISMR